MRLRNYHFEVFAGFLADLSAAWFITSIGARDIWVLTSNFVGGILSLLMAFKTREIAEYYD